MEILGPNGGGTLGDLILDANIAVGGSAFFDSDGGIIQLGGAVQTGGDLSLTAANGIIQLSGDPSGASVLQSVGGNLAIFASGQAATTAGGITTNGISFAGTLSAFSTQAAQGTVSLIASDIVEQSTGQLSATLLTGSAAAGASVTVGRGLFDVMAGNTVTTLGSFTTTADFTLEDDISPTITGPLSIGGSLSVQWS